MQYTRLYTCTPRAESNSKGTYSATCVGTWSTGSVRKKKETKGNSGLTRISTNNGEHGQKLLSKRMTCNIGDIQKHRTQSPNENKFPCGKHERQTVKHVSPMICLYYTKYPSNRLTKAKWHLSGYVGNLSPWSASQVLKGPCHVRFKPVYNNFYTFYTAAYHFPKHTIIIQKK